MQTQEQLKKKYLMRQKWFIDRIEKVVYSDRPVCLCKICMARFENGTLILNEQEAIYIHGYSEDLGMTYHDKR